MGVSTGAANGASAGFMAGPWGALIGGGIGLFGSLFGAHEQSKAADTSARITSDAARYQADQQAKATADALAFQMAAAENGYQNAEVSRRANYDQWAARARRLNSVGGALGYGTSDIPAYVAGVDPQFAGGGAPSVGAALAPTQARMAFGAPTAYRPLPIAPGVTMPDPYRSVGAYLLS